MNKQVIEKLVGLMSQVSKLNADSSMKDIVGNLEECIDIVKIICEDKEENLGVKNSMKMSTLTQITKFRIMILGLVVTLTDNKRMAVESGESFDEEKDLVEAEEAVRSLSEMELRLAKIF